MVIVVGIIDSQIAALVVHVAREHEKNWIYAMSRNFLHSKLSNSKLFLFFSATRMRSVTIRNSLQLEKLEYHRWT